VDAEFIPGNSGSPIINKHDEIVGVATFIKSIDKNVEDWIINNTRYQKARRFATRLDGPIKWIPLHPQVLKNSEHAFHEHNKFIDEANEVILLFSKTPGAHLIEESIQNRYLKNWVKKTNSVNLKLREQISDYQKQFFRTNKEVEKWSKEVDYTLLSQWLGQVRSLIHLSKSRRAQLKMSFAIIPPIGYYSEKKIQLTASYDALVLGLENFAKYVNEHRSELSADLLR